MLGPEQLVSLPNHRQRDLGSFCTPNELFQADFQLGLTYSRDKKVLVRKGLFRNPVFGNKTRRHLRMLDNGSMPWCNVCETPSVWIWEAGFSRVGTKNEVVVEREASLVTTPGWAIKLNGVSQA